MQKALHIYGSGWEVIAGPRKGQPCCNMSLEELNNYLSKGWVVDGIERIEVGLSLVILYKEDEIPFAELVE